jgi:hypothetical protein
LRGNLREKLAVSRAMHISAIACRFVIVVLLLAGMPAHAVIGPVAEESLPDGTRFAAPETFTMTLPTPWRTISQGGRFTTAVCPGNVDSPYCALETLFACHVDGGEACFRAVIDQGFAAMFARRWEQLEVRRFRVTGLRVINGHDVVGLSFGEYPTLGVNIGDVLLFTEEMSCQIQAGPQDDPFKPFECYGDVVREQRYIMQRVGDDWGALAWGDSRDIP